MSMWNRYSPSLFFVGLDSIFVRFMRLLQNSPVSHIEALVVLLWYEYKVVLLCALHGVLFANDYESGELWWLSSIHFVRSSRSQRFAAISVRLQLYLRPCPAPQLSQHVLCSLWARTLCLWCCFKKLLHWENAMRVGVYFFISLVVWRVMRLWWTCSTTLPWF